MRPPSQRNCPASTSGTRSPRRCSGSFPSGRRCRTWRQQARLSQRGRSHTPSSLRFGACQQHRGCIWTRHFRSQSPTDKPRRRLHLTWPRKCFRRNFGRCAVQLAWPDHPRAAPLDIWSTPRLGAPPDSNTRCKTKIQQLTSSPLGTFRTLSPTSRWRTYQKGTARMMKTRLQMQICRANRGCRTKRRKGWVETSRRRRARKLTLGR